MPPVQASLPLAPASCSAQRSAAPLGRNDETRDRLRGRKPRSAPAAGAGRECVVRTKAAKAVLLLGLGVSVSGHAEPATPARAGAAATSDKVTLYVMPQCGYCEKVRSLLQQRGVSWNEIDIASSAQGQREFEARGGRGTPLLIVGGDVVQGADPVRIDAVLRRHGLLDN